MDTNDSVTPFTGIATEYDYEDSSTTMGDYEDGLICERSSVREFRKYYEPALYWIIVILGAIGNSLVVWIYSYFKNRLKSMTDVYLLNLALADLFFLCTLPFWAVDSIFGWTFGLGLCKFVSAIYKINFFSSMFLLTCISVDRYIVIVQTTKAQNSKRDRLLYSKLICVLVWLLAVVLSIPEFLFARSKTDDEGNQFCTMVYWNNENNRTKILVLALQICMGFCIPLIVMIFCYANIVRTLLKTRNFEKHKALRVILAVVAVFVVSQLPYNGMLVFEATQAANMTITNCEEVKRFDIAGQIMKSLAYMHSCLNPFLYAFVGVRFRKDVIRIFQKLGCLTTLKSPKVPRPSLMSDTDTTNALSL
ncbi:C-C chemokine receptor type 9-like [Carassius auratus]|uniref:C-C chemokine receptor type 9-like n=1 Tax=Carassius auratus TaxID=7957 RepID=A0A6P6RCW1_CARAU|nr:C-C chemokine receptor type 9-like [Carassius auratus]XP_052474401.1 C-C chemokine receptor type 9 [Carassius gibelio]